MGREGDYHLLPASNGSGLAPPLSPESYVAGFFSNGKFLLADWNPTFNQSIERFYGTFKSRIVDQALQTGGLRVVALTNLRDEDACLGTDEVRNTALGGCEYSLSHPTWPSS